MNFETRNKIIFTYFLAFVLAACSIIYELLIAQTFTSLTSNTVFWYSLTIGIYLGSMGCGALLCEKLYKNKFTWLNLFKVEIYLSLFGGIAVLMVNYTHIIYIFLTMNDQFYLAVRLLFLIFFFVVVIVGILTGLELPLLIRLCNELSGTKRVANRVLCADYTGSLAGGLILPLVLFPSFDLLSIGCLVALINLSVALFILVYFVRKDCRDVFEKFVLFLILYGLLVILLANSSRLQQYFIKKEYFYKYAENDAGKFFKPFNDFEDIERHSSVYQKIDIAKVPEKYNREDIVWGLLSTKITADPNCPKGYMLFLNHEFQFHSDKEEFYHEYITHIPIILNGSVPHKVLVLGAGDGFLVRELIKYSEIESITLVELDKKMIDLANNHPVFTSINKNSFKDPRVHIEIIDAYYYIKNCKEKYDAIYLDLPVPENYDLSKLYSREFFFFVHRSLKDHGFAAFETSRIKPLFYQKNDGYAGPEDGPGSYWDIYSSTIRTAGFNTVIPYFSNFNGKRKDITRLIYEFLSQNDEEWKKDVDKWGDGKIAYEPIQQEVAAKAADGYLEKNLDGFIMMIKGQRPVNYKYIDFGIPLYVLNKGLFNDAFILNKRNEREIDPKNINSIMRPILPRQFFFKIYNQ
ncbi:MAG: hypothetical protein A2447_11645 [Omnitrophica WOR_2 bacterium RIFOXYC2_FULL_38_12]|nr:MAG: hypothetical protein A2447_11645 [Omnitrophica WOR_2 bacterium RIFOXYC2_FULL_38_12]